MTILESIFVKKLVVPFRHPIKRYYRTSNFLRRWLGKKQTQQKTFLTAEIELNTDKIPHTKLSVNSLKEKIYATKFSVKGKRKKGDYRGLYKKGSLFRVRLGIIFLV